MGRITRGRWMVNWREDIEFIYVLAMLVSSILVFFNLYDTRGLQTAGEWVVIIVVVEAVAGLIAFESDFAIARWERAEKSQPAQ